MANLHQIIEFVDAHVVSNIIVYHKHVNEPVHRDMFFHNLLSIFNFHNNLFNVHTFKNC